MDQDEDNLRPTEPKMIVGWPHNELTLDSNVFFSNLVGQLADHMLQLGANRKQKLHTKIVYIDIHSYKYAVISEIYRYYKTTGKLDSLNRERMQTFTRGFRISELA